MIEVEEEDSDPHLAVARLTWVAKSDECREGLGVGFFNYWVMFDFGSPNEIVNFSLHTNR